MARNPAAEKRILPNQAFGNPVFGFDFLPKTLYLFFMVKTLISSKGQTTIPRQFLKRWKTSRVLWDTLPDGSARVSPQPDIMSLYGSMGNDVPYNPDEKKLARQAIGLNAAQEGLEP